MNPDHIQQLITMVGQAGDGAKDAFIWYLIAQAVPTIFGTSLGLIIALLFAGLAKLAIKRAYENSDKTLRHICNHLRISWSTSSNNIIYAIDRKIKENKNND